MSETNIFGKLKKLFSTQVVVRRTQGNKLKVVDSSKLQSSGNMGATSYYDRYGRMHRSNRNTYTYNDRFNYQANRVQLYSEYEVMDKDSIIASVLDIYSDETTLYDSNGDVLAINSPDPNIKKILHNLFYDVLNIEFNLWSWVRTMTKYGDSYLYLDIDDEYGIVNVEPLSTYETTRDEGYDKENPYSVRFKVESQGERYLESFQVAHFRLLTDTNFLPYGRSLIEPARNVWKQLTLMEDAMLIHRIMRAPEKRIFKIDVGNIPPNEIDSHMENVISKMKKTPYVDQKTGEYNLKFNLQNMLEDYYLAVRGDHSGTEIDTLTGMEFGGIDDIEYLRNRMLAALKVPKAFIGYTEGVDGKCISPDTKITLIDGNIKTVDELITEFDNGIKNYVYSIDLDTNNMVAGEIEWAGYTRMNTETIKVWLDNGEYIQCTPDHKFLTRDGQWIEAQYLTPNQSLMPLYLKDGGYKGHYTKVYHPSTGKYELVHKLVANQNNLSNDGKVTHHIDFNSRNNNPDNLDCTMGFWEHREYHSKLSYKTINSPENITKRINDPNWLKSASAAGKVGGAKSGVRLGQWVKDNGPVNKKETQYIECDICNTIVQIPYYRKDTAKICSSDKCKSEYFTDKQLNTVLYNDKAKSITYDELIENAILCNSFKELERKLNVSRGVLNKVFNRFEINRNEFVCDYMPLSHTNNGFINNFDISEYKNHKVSHIEIINEKIDTCDLTIKKYHNFATAAGVIIHNSTLAQQDIRFARTIERIQKIVVSELTKIAIVHLYTHGYEDDDLVNFSLSLNTPSIVYEQEKIDLLTQKVNLIRDMKELRLLSHEYLYENILNMSKDDWEQEQFKVINDLKLEFRQEQISVEGNDPAKTGESFGTPHDLATVNQPSEAASEAPNGGSPEGGWPGAGRPKESGKYGKDKATMGRDPMGTKSVDTKPNKAYPDERKSPLSTERVNTLVSKMDKPNGKTKTKEMIMESLRITKSIDNYKENRLLDEKNIMDLED